MHHRSRRLYSAALVFAVVVAWLMPTAVAGQAQSADAPRRSPMRCRGPPTGTLTCRVSGRTRRIRRSNGRRAWTRRSIPSRRWPSSSRGRAAREASLTTPGTIPDVHYDFTQFGLDRSQSPFARNLRTSLIVDPPYGRLPPVNAEGRRRAAEVAAERERLGGRWDSAEANQLDDRCIIMRGAGPPMMNAGYNANYQIVQNRDYVMFLVEMIHDARIIPLDGRPAPPERARQWMGMSRGRWEGDTLVVETTNINGKNPFNGSSDRMRVTERFTRAADDTILYRFTVDDPLTWDRPWTAEMPMKETIGPLFEHACHEGNYGLYNTLVGARLEEQRAAEAAAREESQR